MNVFSGSNMLVRLEVTPYLGTRKLSSPYVFLTRILLIASCRRRLERAQVVPSLSSFVSEDKKISGPRPLSACAPDFFSYS